MTNIPNADLLSVVAIIEAATIGDHEAKIGAIVNNLSHEALAKLLLQMPWTTPVGDPDGAPNLPFVGEVAAILGPDWAQALYHFSVRVTKIA